MVHTAEVVTLSPNVTKESQEELYNLMNSKIVHLVQPLICFAIVVTNIILVWNFAQKRQVSRVLQNHVLVVVIPKEGRVGIISLLLGPCHSKTRPC